MLYKQVRFLFINLLLPHVNCSSRMCFLADGYLFLPFFFGLSGYSEFEVLQILTMKKINDG